LRPNLLSTAATTEREGDAMPNETSGNKRIPRSFNVLRVPQFCLLAINLAVYQLLVTSSLDVAVSVSDCVAYLSRSIRIVTPSFFAIE
jgi:hypothetical protein